jgi:tetratricopeptide (TPR) repeat protein
MCKNILLSIALTAAIAGQLIWANALIAGNGFPGKGDQSAWSNALPHYNLANRYLNDQRYDEAAAQYREAISLYPYDPDFHINLGVVCRKLDDYTGAEQAFKKALELDSSDWMSWSNLGNAYLKQNKLKETIAAFQKSLKCNPPVSEKPKLQQDIADINKILSMQEGSQHAQNTAKTAAVKSSSVKKKGQSSAPGTTRVVVPGAAAGPAKMRQEQDMKSSGWDWVDKN